MTHTIAINNTNLPALNYDNKPIVTFKMIDTVHQRPTGTAIRNFRANKKRFVEEKHFYLLDSKRSDEFRQTYPDVFEGTIAGNLFLITESGYLKLTKSFNDDLAWDIQDMLVDHYFRHEYPSYERINSTQQSELTEEMHKVIRLMSNSKSASGWLYNSLRHQFDLQDIKDLPVKDLPLAKSLVQSLLDSVRAYKKWKWETDEQFIKEVIGGTNTWTPTLKGKFKKTFNEQIPARPDWLAIEQQLKQAIK